MLTKIKFDNQEDWLQKRRQFIGASEVAILTGNNRYQTPLDLYLSKVEGIEQPQNERMRWGLLLEETIAKEWALRNNTKVKRSNYLYVWGDILAATLDFVDSFGRVIEIKNMSDYAFRSYDLIRGVPDMYYIQMQAQLLCTGKKDAVFVALINNGELIEQEVERDEDLIKTIQEKVKDFYSNHIATKTPPPISSRDVKKEDIDTENLIDGDESDYELFEKIKTLSLAISDLEKQKKELQEKVKERIGDKGGIIYQGDKLFWYSKSIMFNSKEFQKDNPDLYEKYKNQVVVKLNIAR